MFGEPAHQRCTDRCGSSNGKDQKGQDAATHLRCRCQLQPSAGKRFEQDAARAEAARIAAEAKQASARDTEAKVKKAADKIGLKVEAAEAKIREALNSARAEIEAVAAEATREMVGRLTGIAVDSKDAAAAVKAELNV